MKGTTAKLTAEERDVLVLAALHPCGKHLSNSEIGQRLNLPVNRVKTLIHQACLKLGAHNRYEAVIFAMKRGELSLNQFYSLEDLAGIFSSLGTDMLRRIAQLMRQEPEHGSLLEVDEQIIFTDRRQDTTLTQRERDVLILVGRGLTSMEIADRLYITVGTVGLFLSRACTKLGAHSRTDAVVSALKQREIGVGEILSFNEVLRYLAPLGADSVEKMAQLIHQKLGQEPIPAGS